MPDVTVVTCGGTIASEPADAGATPAKDGAELVTAVPELDAHADVSVTDVASRPSFDLDFKTLAAVGRAVESASETADGVVITHGTDTLADTAYALDLVFDPPVPVVVTGSQRRFDEPGSDAPSNLLVAVRTAADDQFAGGVTVAFDDEVHAARDAVKTHTSALDTFQSPGKGPVAELARGEVRTFREPASRSTSLPLSSLDARATVPVVHSGIGVGAGSLERALDAGADGVVVDATGLGNVTAPLGEVIADATDRVPVVVASRCQAGVTDPVYGTPGGGVTLDRRGALFAGDLPASKARIELALALTAGESDVALAERFA